MELEPQIAARFAVSEQSDQAQPPDQAKPRWHAGQQIRCHGDYHLGQTLYTGNDFIILDFEGEPARTLAERRSKRSPLKDVAGMLRSFDYAVHVALRELDAKITNRDVYLAWGRTWHTWICAAFLQAYLSSAQAGSFLPSARAELESQLDFFLLEKAVYELKYELNNRPDWVGIPLSAILQLVDREN